MKVDLNKIYQTIFIIVTLFLCIYIFNLYKDKNNLAKETKYYQGLVKDKSKTVIEVNQKQIEYLTKLNLQKDIEILKSKKTIDSLNAQSVKIKYVYINKIKQIELFDAIQLQNYWRNEIK
jgi:hypothetical protein